jgi:hypothetical protein
MGADDTRNDWTVETLRQYFIVALNDFKIRADEVRKESDLRYQQRFEASERAASAAANADKEAVRAALAAVERSISAALAAAEKAIDKAELGQHALNIGLSERLDISIAALTEKVNLNANGLNKSDGRTLGVSATFAAVISIIAVVASLAGVAVSVFSSRSDGPHYPPFSHVN